jgi:exopolyphosphatase/guanosine-5'-triphosphate,3'-diphosphate pyrophosphatase
LLVALSWPGAKRNEIMAIRAVIDVGTNSVKLLVADVQGGAVEPIFEGSEQTRLGAGFYETHQLSRAAIDATAKVIRKFADLAYAYAPWSLHVLATSAARDAVNRDELEARIKEVADLYLAVIDGDEEANFAFLGVASDPQLKDRALLVVDIGGGSTEFILGANGHRQAARSFQIGSVRLLEKFRVSDPPTKTEREICLAWLRSFFAQEIRPFLQEHRKEAASPTLVSTGGTASILGRMKWKLAAYDREKIEGTVLTTADLAAETKRLWSMPIEERRQLPGLPSSRADVILMGSAILEAAAEALGFSEARVSIRGLRYGVLLRAESHGAL